MADHQHSTLILVIIGLLVLTGLPKRKIRYRILTSLVAVLCVCSSVLWYESYYVAHCSIFAINPGGPLLLDPSCS